MEEIPLCPEVDPTDAELEMSPLDFFQLLHRRFGHCGIVKVRIPEAKRPRYQGLKTSARFRAKIQPLHLLDGVQRQQRYLAIQDKIGQWRANRVHNPPAAVATPADLLGRTFFKAFRTAVLLGKVVSYDGEKFFQVEYATQSGRATTASTPCTTPSSTPLRGLQQRKLQRVDSGFSEVAGHTKHEFEELRIFVENGRTEAEALELQEVLSREEDSENFCAVCAKYLASDALSALVSELVRCVGECGEAAHSACACKAELWACSACETSDFPHLKRLLDFGYELTTTLDLKEFRRRALAEIPAERAEQEFFAAIRGERGEVKAVYGSDLDSLQVEAFPSESEIRSLRASEEFWQSSLDLRLLPVHPQSLLSALYDAEISVNGVSRPWTYVGSPLSAFCWHAEDHWLYSVNYMHSGAAKIWYGCPGERIDQIEEFFRSQLPLLYAQHGDLHHHLVTFLDPAKLLTAGVPVYKAVQEVGDLIVTFPRAYHAGFNAGFNVAEAVNVGCSDWLSFGLASERRYVDERRPQVLSQEFLVWAAAQKAVAAVAEAESPPDFTTAPLVVEELQRVLRQYETLPGHLEISQLDSSMDVSGRRSQRRVLEKTLSSASDAGAPTSRFRFQKCATCGRLPFFLLGRARTGEVHCAEHHAEGVEFEALFEGVQKQKLVETLEQLLPKVEAFRAWSEEVDELVQRVKTRKSRLAQLDICASSAKKKRRRTQQPAPEQKEVAALIDQGERNFHLPRHHDTLWTLSTLLD